MVIKEEIKDTITDRLFINEYLLDEDVQFLKGRDKEEIYRKQLEELLDIDGKKTLREYIHALENKYLSKEVLAYLIGASDYSKMKNILDEIP